MVWLQSVLRYLHVVGAIFWFGSSLFLQFVLAPAVRAMQFAAGVLGNLGSAYGITFLASIAGAVFVIVVGARFVGPTAEKLAEAKSREEIVQLTDKIRGYGRYDTRGMLVMIGMMVAMRAGY